MELAPEFVDVARIRRTNFARVAGIDPGAGALEAHARVADNHSSPQANRGV